jgi:hypothetical protein
MVRTVTSARSIPPIRQADAGAPASAPAQVASTPPAAR